MNIHIPQAFEIPLPKSGKSPPPVAERLANTPRNAATSEEIEAKLENAAIKRENMLSMKAETLKAATDAKLQRGRKAVSLVAADARRLETEIENKLSSAQRRKEVKTEEMVRYLSEKNDGKIERGQIAMSTQQKNTQEKLKDFWKKVEEASSRREGLLNLSSAKASAEHQVKVQKAKAAAFNDFKQQREIERTLEERMHDAEIRRKKVLKEAVSKQNKKHSPPKHSPPTSPSLTCQDIEKKIAVANERRDNFLSSKSKASSTKKVRSPREPRVTVDAIEAKLYNAAQRREAYLKKRMLSPAVAKNLSFSSVSPGTGTSPRLKAARLETPTSCCDEELPQPILIAWKIAIPAIILSMALVRFSSSK